MKTTNHTPGPWAVSPYNNITSRNGTIAKTEQMPGNDDSEREANARLIASGPDLLSALQDICAMVVSPNDTRADILAHARAAIAKAEGAK